MGAARVQAQSLDFIQFEQGPVCDRKFLHGLQILRGGIDKAVRTEFRFLHCRRHMLVRRFTDVPQCIRVVVRGYKNMVHEGLRQAPALRKGVGCFGRPRGIYIWTHAGADHILSNVVPPFNIHNLFLASLCPGHMNGHEGDFHTGVGEAHPLQRVHARAELLRQLSLLNAPRGPPRAAGSQPGHGFNCGGKVLP